MSFTETNWNIITGGPSSGTTKTGEYLAFKGEFVIPECARVLIDNEMSKGKTMSDIRGDEAAFQAKVLEMKVECEARIPSRRKAFLIRGLPDSIAYSRVFNLTNDNYPGETTHAGRYRRVFLLDQLPFEDDYARTEDQSTAEKINQALYNVYTELSYPVLRVPVMSIEDRAEFILSEVNGKLK